MKTNKSRLHTLASHSFKLDHNINQLNQLWFIDLLINSWRCGEKYKIMHSSTQNYLYCAGMSSWTKWSLLIIALFRPFASILRSMSLTYLTSTWMRIKAFYSYGRFFHHIFLLDICWLLSSFFNCYPFSPDLPHIVRQIVRSKNSINLIDSGQLMFIMWWKKNWFHWLRESNTHFAGWTAMPNQAKRFA